MENKNLYTVAKLAEKSGYCNTSISRWLRQKVLHKYYVNGKPAVDYDEFVNFLTANNIKKPYKKSKSVQQFKVEPVKVEPVKVISEKQVLANKLSEVLELSCNNHVLTPNQYMAIHNILTQLNEGEN